MATPDAPMQPAPKRGRFDAAKRLYDWYDKFDTWRERIDFAIGFFKANAAATASTAAAGAVATAGVVVVANPQLIETWFPPKQPVEIVQPDTPPKAAEPPVQQAKVEVTTERWGEALVFPVNGADAAGKRASFDVAVLPKAFTWARKDDAHLAHDGKMLTDAQVQERVFTDDFRAGLGRSRDVIGVGVASQEGDVTEETGRAARRAKTSGEWLAKGTGAGVWLLNLGQYKGSCATADKGDTSWQRPVIMIGVRGQDEGVNLAQALGDAISGKSNLPSRDCYSNFEMKRRE